MNLFQRKKNGPWYVRFRHPVTGKDTWRCTQTTDRKTAELLAKQVEISIARQKFGLEAPDTERHIPLSEFAERYLKHIELDRAPNTVQANRQALAALERIVGDKMLPEIEPIDFELFKVNRAEKTSSGTVNTNLRALKAAFRRAVQWNYLTESPASGVALLRTPKSPPRYLSENEIQQLLATDEDPRVLARTFGRMIRFFLLTGLRRNELLFLEWTDLDLGKGLLYVQNKALFRTKTDASERQIPISRTLRALLDEIGPQPEGYIFPSPNGGPYSPQFISHKFKDRIRRAGLDEHYNLHTLRHTFATHLRDRGVGLDIIAQLLGHTSLETTRIYGHLMPGNVKSAISLLQW